MVCLYEILMQIQEISNITKQEDEYYKKIYNLSQVYNCQVHYKENEFNIIVGIKNDFPLTNLYVFWADYREQFFPHIEENDGKVCYMDDESYIFDNENIAGIVSSCINMSVEQIYRGKNELNKEDFINEFEPYWYRLENKIPISCYIKIDKNIKIIKTYLLEDKFLAYENKIDLEKLLSKTKHVFNDDNIVRGIYIPLENNKELFPPKHNEMWSIGKLRNIIFKNLSFKNQKILNGILKNSKKIVKSIIISFPKPNGEIGLFGIFISNITKIKGNTRFSAHPLISPFFKCEISPLYVERKDKNFLLNRGGAVDILLDKKVLILGCGSLGGYIIEELVKAGISKFTIVDKDFFKDENLFRHVLGEEQINFKLSYKAEEMKKYLEKKYRNISIDTIVYDLVDSIEDGSIVLEEFDLVIVAIGNPNIEFYLNKKIYELERKLPTIYTWIEAYGVGGHVLVTNNSKHGCYNCLYYDSFTLKKTLVNKASLIDINENIIKKKAGCGSSYIPYSALDAIQTAILCVRTSLQVLLGEEKNNPLLTWKGDNKYNVKTTSRYNLSSEKMIESKYLYKSEKCNVCNIKESK